MSREDQASDFLWAVSVASCTVGSRHRAHILSWCPGSFHWGLLAESSGKGLRAPSFHKPFGATATVPHFSLIVMTGGLSYSTTLHRGQYSDNESRLLCTWCGVCSKGSSYIPAVPSRWPDELSMWTRQLPPLSNGQLSVPLFLVCFEMNPGLPISQANKRSTPELHIYPSPPFLFFIIL